MMTVDCNATAHNQANVSMAPTARSIRAIAMIALKMLANAVVVVGLGLLTAACCRQFTVTGSLNSLGLLVVNALFVIMYATRREAREMSTAPGLWLLAFAGTILPMWLRPNDEPGLVGIGNTVQMLGICLIVAALFSLQRSFGVVPANRGVRNGGLYRIVRHPLYAAELLAVLGVVLANPSVWNLLLWATECALQFARACAEENLLSADAAYRAYRDRVRYRLVPGLI
jgi:protein-S-isoprenylcysteine O-methyltransferase Ste14